MVNIYDELYVFRTEWFCRVGSGCGELTAHHAIGIGCGNGIIVS